MTTPAYAPARTDGAEIRPGPPCPCEARVEALEAEVTALREAIRAALDGLPRSWCSTHTGMAGALPAARSPSPSPTTCRDRDGTPGGGQ